MRKPLTLWRGREHELSPFEGLHRNIDRVFEEFWRGFDLAPLHGSSVFGEVAPSLDVNESDDEIRVSAELPGLDEKDIDVELSDGRLVIKGEKKAETEEERGGYYLRERSFGSFHRAIALPTDVDTAKAKATFEKGVLTIALPKTQAAKTVKKIAIKSK